MQTIDDVWLLFSESEYFFSMRKKKKTHSPLKQSQTDKNFGEKIAVCQRVWY